MTLCIAAVCDNVRDKEPKIVLCADLQNEVAGIGGAETEDKLGFVRKGWPVLLAGTIHKANDLINVYASYLDKHYDEITEFDLVDHLRKPAHIQKRKLIDEYLRQNYGFDADYLFGRGSSALAPRFASKVLSDVAKIKLNASLIIAGFKEGTDFVTGTVAPWPFLASVEDSADITGSQEYVQLESDVACVGSGSYAAKISLYRRSQSAEDSLSLTLYNVYEANRLSENVPGVGKDYLRMYVLNRDGTLHELSDQGHRHLRKMYAKFGPRVTDEDLLEVKSNFLEPY